MNLVSLRFDDTLVHLSYLVDKITQIVQAFASNHVTKATRSPGPHHSLRLIRMYHPRCWKTDLDRIHKSNEQQLQRYVADTTIKSFCVIRSSTPSLHHTATASRTSRNRHFTRWQPVVGCRVDHRQGHRHAWHIHSQRSACFRYAP